MTGKALPVAVIVMCAIATGALEDISRPGSFIRIIKEVDLLVSTDLEISLISKSSEQAEIINWLLHDDDTQIL